LAGNLALASCNVLIFNVVKGQFLARKWCLGFV
jgi:hypothetical protein